MRSHRFVLALSASLVLVACGGPEVPQWLDLARAEPEGLRLALEEVDAGARVVEEGEDLWLAAPIAREAWHEAEGEGCYATSMPVLAVGHPVAGGGAYRLVAGERRFEYETDSERFGRESGHFTTRAAQGLRLELALAADEALPELVELWACLSIQEREVGVARVAGRRLSGSGFWVPNGRPSTIALSIPPQSRLTFATSVEPLFGARELRQAAHTFRVRLDGAVLFERRLSGDILGEAFEWHAIELPRGGVRKAQLEFEVEGPLALTSFLAPHIGPSEFGSYAARPPWGERRADLVVFLADTFRADNLAAYGSRLALTPEIDRFAEEARVFPRTWSTSTHTLPAHSSMFSGVFPPQNGQVDYDNPLPDKVETLAELLTAQGYRCGLISDGVMVSRVHGLDQGFEIFDERRESGTLERVRAFLEADDGRPIFLFAQTYAAHTPYKMSPETRARWGDVLRLDRTYEEVMSTELMRQEESLAEDGPPTDPEAREIAARLQGLYRAGVSELDTLFGQFRAGLESHGLPGGDGYLVFTSDHGEAFFEHGRPFHANRVFEEELRIPLIVAGPRAEIGREEAPVSLIDFAPSLAELAGLRVPPHWRGRSWLAPEPERVVYAFQSNDFPGGSTLAVIQSGRKWMGYDDLEAVRRGALHAAFDLERDPTERVNLYPDGAWPEEARAHLAQLEELLTPLVTPEFSRFSAEERAGMKALGYSGSEEDE